VTEEETKQKVQQIRERVGEIQKKQKRVVGTQYFLNPNAGVGDEDSLYVENMVREIEQFELSEESERHSWVRQPLVRAKKQLMIRDGVDHKDKLLH